jgi:hypothetical protein
MLDQQTYEHGKHKGLEWFKPPEPKLYIHCQMYYLSL